MIEIGKTIKERRKALGMSQMRLAEAAGVAESTVATIESGMHSPVVYNLEAILDVLGLKLEVTPK